VPNRESALALLAQSQAIGPAFFNTAVEALARALACRWAGVGLFQADAYRIDVVSFWDNGKLAQPFTFDLHGAPCEVVYDSARPHTHVYFPDHVAEQFPADSNLARLGVRCYRGELFCDAKGKPAGHVFTLNDLPEPDNANARFFFQLVSQRVGAEYKRWQSEQALQTAEARYRTLIETQTDLVCRSRPDTTLLFVNPAYATFFGKTPEQLIGTSFETLIAPADREATRQKLAKLSPTNPVNSNEEYLVNAQGQARWFHWVNQGIFNQQGKLVEVQSVGRDINTHKLAELALRDSEARFRQLAETIEEVFYIIDPAQSRLVYLSPGFEKIWGCASGPIYQDPWALIAMTHSADRAKVKQNLTRKLQGEAVDTFYRILRPDGDLRWIRDRSYPLRDNSGRCYRLIGIAEDITALKTTEAALYAEKERAQITLHSIGDAVITTNVRGEVEFLNPIAEKLTGWRQEEVQGQHVSEVLHLVDEADRQKAYDPIGLSLAAGRTIYLTGDMLLLNRYGKEYAVEDSAAPIRAQDNTVFGAVLVFRDVTVNRQLRQQLSYDAAHDPLTGLVNRREFEQRLRHALDGARRQSTRHVLCYIDLDHFKIVNDSAGHTAGDHLLRSLKDVIGHLFRERDTFSRLGGDEFGLLLDNCPLSKGVQIAENILTALHDYDFSWQDRSFQIGASIGVIEITPAANNIEDLLKQADAACYTAKRQGRNQVYAQTLAARNS